MLVQRGLFTPVKVGPLELPEPDRHVAHDPHPGQSRAASRPREWSDTTRNGPRRASSSPRERIPARWGEGTPYPPGLHTEEQAAGWRKVTDAVHAAGGRIFVQLMHAGRVSHSSLLPDHALPVAPSAIAVSGEIHTFGGKVPFETPRPWKRRKSPPSSQSIVGRRSCRSRRLRRGGTPCGDRLPAEPVPSHRVEPPHRRLRRFAREANPLYPGSDRGALRRAGCGSGRHQDRSRLHGQRHLRRRPRRDVHLPRPVSEPAGPGLSSRRLRQRLRARDRPAVQPHRPSPSGYAGTLLAVGGFNKATGEAAIAAGRADVIVYARPFISNPDLVERFRLDAPLNPWDVRTFYGGDDHGYTDYPTLG